MIWRLLQSSELVSQKRRDRLVNQLQQALHAADANQMLHALLTLNTNHTSQPTQSQQATDDSSQSEMATEVIEQSVTSILPVTDSDQAAASSASSASSSASLVSVWSPSSRVSYFGSLLLQSLLSLPVSDPQLSSALVSLSSDELYRLACDGSGGPVIECLLRVHSGSSFSHPMSTQRRLIDVLLPRVSELALSSSGSYVVERMYGAADVQRKRAIAQSLAKDEKRLRHSKPAAMLLRRCGVKHLQTSNKVVTHPAPHLTPTSTANHTPPLPAPYSGHLCHVVSRSHCRLTMPMAAHIAAQRLGNSRGCRNRR